MFELEALMVTAPRTCTVSPGWALSSAAWIVLNGACQRAGVLVVGFGVAAGNENLRRKGARRGQHRQHGRTGTDRSEREMLGNSSSWIGSSITRLSRNGIDTKS